MSDSRTIGGSGPTGTGSDNRASVSSDVPDNNPDKGLPPVAPTPLIGNHGHNPMGSISGTTKTGSPRSKIYNPHPRSGSVNPVSDSSSQHPSRPQSPAIRPQPRWRGSSGPNSSGGALSLRKYKYSTEDDEDEVEADLEREYYEGYSDGLKEKIRRSTIKADREQLLQQLKDHREQKDQLQPSLQLPSLSIGPSYESQQQAPRRTDSPSITSAASTTALLGTPRLEATDEGILRHRKSELIADLLADDDGGNTVEAAKELLGDDPHRHYQTHQRLHSIHHHHDDHSVRSSSEHGGPRSRDAPSVKLDKRFVPEDDDRGYNEHGHEEGENNGDDEDGENDDDDDDDGASIASNETFTLRERQDAINTTHPFGIRIWKPAVYKKVRSVQRIAEGDLHSTPGKDVQWTVWMGNILWTVLFGTILFITCGLGSVLCLIFFWSESAQLYGVALFKLGTYFWFPFGHYVELAQDENYLDEDEGEGLSIADYQRWQAGDVEYGRLFFGPASSSRDNNTGSNGDAGSNVNSPSANINIQSNTGAGSDGILADPSTPAPETHDESIPLLRSPGSGEFRRKRRLFGRGEWNLGRVLFYLWFYVVVCPILYTISLVCWLGVFSIPMARVATILIPHLRRHPLALSFKPASSFFSEEHGPDRTSSIILCTYRAWGWNYYKYTIDGTNVIIINLMLPVLFVIFDYFVLYETLHIDNFITNPATVFSLSLASIVPLAYFIGQAVASISAQSSMGMGAAINAFFSTVVEVFLYTVALSQGKGDLVEGSIVGSILAGVLLLPGTSMCAGAIRRKTQRYNPRSAGVSSTMLVFAVIGAFAPTVFYQIYGSYELRCVPCPIEAGALAPSCRKCRFEQLPLVENEFFLNVIQPFSVTCAFLLFVSYVIGLWFTLRTHAAMIWATPTVSEQPMFQHLQNIIPSATTQQVVPAGLLTGTQPFVPPTTPVNPSQQGSVRRQSTKHVAMAVPPVAHVKEDMAPESEGGGHDAPNWGRLKSSVILLGATVLYAIIAEILVDTVDVVLKNFAISEKFLGITIFALVPNTTEFLNAISFAIHGNIALSMEIGSAYALQVCLLQIPALVFYSIYSAKGLVGPIHEFAFTLVFPRWDLWVVIFCVFLFSYIYAEGKSNYFKGSILILAYLVVMAGFFFSDVEIANGILGNYGTFVLPELNYIPPPALSIQN
ncbi:Vnx1p [Sugiyamaella lignohabitans]|uniref:Vnx1p n=1 Tax=Sugiyamaella lignohabitans TaxID=796027 RepID=A0A167DYB1_9ASCO|nr:Vnx1p [Sugiyamaella lignohabitans]ANB13438.1 Vnx1p [Sugiyamaella lignohabitans]